MRPLGQQVLLEELWGLLGMLPELLEVRLVGQQELLAPQPVQRGVLQATLAELRLVLLVA